MENQDVTHYIQNIKQDWQPLVCNRVHQLIHQLISGVDERIQYGKPHDRKNGQYACVLGTAKEWVSFTIFAAGSLEAPEGSFEAEDSNRKTIEIRKSIMTL